MVDTSMRVDSEINDRLTGLSQSMKLSKNDILAYFMDLCEKYGFFDPDWLDKLKGNIVTEISQATNDDEKLNRLLTIEKIRVVNKARMKAFEEYIKVLEGDEKKTFLEKILMIQNNENWLDVISDFQLIRVNGQTQMLQVNDQGLPILNIRSELIESCQNGFHIKGQFCKCSLWRDCEIRINEYALYKENRLSNLPSNVMISRDGKIIREGRGV